MVYMCNIKVMVMVQWVTVRIPSDLMHEVEKFIERSNLYISKSEFVRDAIRKKIVEEKGKWRDDR
jgi:metal-responsive CopG/Arc/MetJ family transcriptional regulator